VLVETIAIERKVMRKAKKRFIEAKDLYRLNLVTAVAMSPDESEVAYTVETISEDRRKYFSHIHVANCNTGKSGQFTFGEVNDRGPVWSPDGESITFISTRNKKTGIYVIPSGGGAERKVIEEDGAFFRLAWTPNGQELVYAFRYNDSHYIKDEEKKKEVPLYRHITRLKYRWDGGSFLPRDCFHIWKVNVESGKARQLTKGKRDEFCHAVSPDGKLIAFVSNRARNEDINFCHWDLFVIPTNGHNERKIPTPPGPVFWPVFSPDGKTIAYYGHARPDSKGDIVNQHVWTVGVSGTPAARDLTPEFDRTTTDLTIGDMGEGNYMMPACWSPNGSRIYFVAMDTGNTHIFFVSSKGGRPARVTQKKCHVKDYSLNGHRKLVAALVSDPKTPSEVHLIPATSGGDSRGQVLISCNKELFSDVTLPRVREVWFRAYDGIRLQGWLMTPPNLNTKRKHPAILQIHGGPYCQYGFTFFHEMLFLASKGYVVFYTNPRGSGGRGETFASAIVGKWGIVDYPDLLAAADYLEKLPYVNKNRMGVTGGSYGGFMTNWIIGHTDRFAAAVTQRSVVNLESMVGSSAGGYQTTRTFGYPWIERDLYRKCSPLTYAENIKTPLLIIHSENDGLNIEQAEQLFATLKLMKKKVEFIRFPGESHGLSRHGRPDRRLARLEWILKWFDRYLK
jgi:dipeptidyl aminopeptidase/acylaminoacyl peptidase